MTDLEKIRERWARVGVKIDAYLDSSRRLHLSKIVVPRETRGEGTGTSAMRDLTALADKYRLTMTLTPATDFGGSSVERLKKFYKRFGFIENKGRNKDFEISASMYRPPMVGKIQEDAMRFPSINDVSAELRRINKQDSADDGDDGGIDVRLQVLPDSTWTVNWGASDYDQDHRGYWGSSSVPGDNRRFDSKDIARDLIEQAREQKATGNEGDEGGWDDDGGGMTESPRRVASRKQPSLPGYEDVPEKIEIQIPNMPMWEQVDGDMSPDKYGGTIARSDGDYLELLKIQPVREYVGDGEAAEVGFPFWTREASFDASDLDPSRDEVRKALGTIDMRMDDLADLTPKQQALTIACALLDYGNAEEGPAGWSSDIIHDKVKWSSGKVAGAEYLEDEDEEFRREILGEEDEEDDDEEDDEEESDEDE